MPGGKLKTKNDDLWVSFFSFLIHEISLKILEKCLQNKILADTERQIKDTRSRAARDLMSKEEKLNRIRGILDGKKLTQSAGSPLRTQTSSPALKSVSLFTFLY